MPHLKTPGPWAWWWPQYILGLEMVLKSNQVFVQLQENQVCLDPAIEHCLTVFGRIVYVKVTEFQNVCARYISGLKKFDHFYSKIFILG